MSIEQDVAAAREAVDALEQACNRRAAPVHGQLSTAGVWNEAFEDAPLVARPGVQ